MNRDAIHLHASPRRRERIPQRNFRHLSSFDIVVSRNRSLSANNGGKILFVLGTVVSAYRAPRMRYVFPSAPNAILVETMHRCVVDRMTLQNNRLAICRQSVWFLTDRARGIHKRLRRIKHSQCSCVIKLVIDEIRFPLLALLLRIIEDGLVELSVHVRASGSGTGIE